MASVLHCSARTTPRIRAELKAAKAQAGVLANQYGLNRKIVLKWRNRNETAEKCKRFKTYDIGDVISTVPK
jgi:hypothetical protein